MGEKYVKKIVNLTIISENWQSSSATGGGNVSYTVQGEIKNSGLSEVKNALLIASIVNKKSNKTFQLVSKKFTIFKAADYSILPPLKSGDILPFEITINFPSSKFLLLGKWGLRSLEDKLLKGKCKQKLYLLYDTKVLDDSTQEWFMDELLENLKLIRPQWSPMHNKNKELIAFKCSGKIKNIGNKAIKKFNVQGVLEDEYGDTLKLNHDEKEYTIQGNQEFEEILPNTRLSFEFTCRLPSQEILSFNKLSSSEIEKRVEIQKIKTRLAIAYLDYKQQKLTYMDVDESPTIIEEDEGNKKIEIIEEDWALDEKNDEYTISGKIKNTGSRDVEYIYIIASIIDKESEKPIAWESATDTLKTLVIEKISYLKINDDWPYEIKLKLPHGKILGKAKWNSKNIQGGVSDGSLIRKVELYYTREDVFEEGMKRLRFGNSYFLLKNFRGCLREYTEGIKLIPDEKRFYLNIGLCYYKEGAIQRAIEYTKKALNIDDQYEKAYYLLGLLYHTMKKYSDALPWYRKAYDIDKSNPKIIYNMGCAEFGDNKINEGIQWLDKAFNFDKTRVITQMIKDPELNPVRKNAKFAEFLKDLRKREIVKSK
ncbi:DUF2393 family protein [candidate division KSB1 bacterium]|nr:DUF2393 family protein [candidate division KSB1 bacterium]